MDTEILMRHFARIGAELNIELVPAGAAVPRWAPVPAVGRGGLEYALDTATRRSREIFVLRVREDVQETMQFLPLDVRPADRLLLLMAKPVTAASSLPRQKFLCGHDERAWFVASAPAASTSVRSAIEALKPPAVRVAQDRARLSGVDRQRRHNAAFIRQGEWFFLPRPEFEPPATATLFRNEPIRRGSGKPHLVEWIVRSGGVTVHVTRKYPAGLTEPEYRRLLQAHPAAANWSWRVMQREPQVYARGKVRHPDHRTIELPFWHQVLMNAEPVSKNVVFLD
jgi:hypothetical protein